jgi:hypothetical protein
MLFDDSCVLVVQGRMAFQYAGLLISIEGSATWAVLELRRKCYVCLQCVQYHLVSLRSCQPALEVQGDSTVARILDFKQTTRRTTLKLSRLRDWQNSLPGYAHEMKLDSRAKSEEARYARVD